MPVSAADLYKPKPALGSVSANGKVEVRGISISEEGTLFAGDSIKSLDKAYAKVLLRNGSKLELAEKTEINVQPDGENVQVAMATGMMGFTSLGNRLRIKVQPYEVVSSSDASGNVTVSPTAATFRSLKGSLTVRNLKTSESYVVTAGQDRLFGLDGNKRSSLGEIASNLPGPIPTRQTPAGQTRGGGYQMDTGAWIAVIGGAAAAALLITTFVMTLNNRDDIKDLNARVDTLTSGQTANLAAIRALQTAVSAAQTAAQVQATGSQVATASSQTAAAINASNLSAQQKATLTAQAAAITAQANAAAAAAATALAQLQTLQSQIAASGTVTAAQEAQINALRAIIETQRAAVNAAIVALNNLINTANSLGANIPGAPIQPVPSGSASIPS